ncbi:MAG TPA: HDOD domain-containing protein [Capillibacterium sp.]
MTLLELVETRMRELPTLPQIAQRVVSLINNPSSSASEVEQVIKHDQALTARVLKLVNSAYYGFPRQITTVGQGIVIMGYKALRELVLRISVAELFRMKNTHTGFDRTALWQHAVGTAAGAKILARQAGLPLEEEAFIAGLLHDLGILLLDLCLTTEFEELIRLTRDCRLPLIRAEEKVLGFNHTLVGKMLAVKWNLPPLYVEVLQHHHQPAQTRNYWAATALVFLADNLAQEAGVGFLEGYDADPDFKTEVWGWLELPPDQKTAVRQQIRSEMLRAAQFFALY